MRHSAARVDALQRIVETSPDFGLGWLALAEAYIEDRDSDRGRHRDAARVEATRVEAALAALEQALLCEPDLIAYASTELTWIWTVDRSSSLPTRAQSPGLCLESGCSRSPGSGASHRDDNTGHKDDIVHTSTHAARELEHNVTGFCKQPKTCKYWSRAEHRVPVHPVERDLDRSLLGKLLNAREQDNRRQSLLVLQRLLRAYPSDPAVLYHFAIIARRAGQVENAGLAAGRLHGISPDRFFLLMLVLAGNWPSSLETQVWSGEFDVVTS